MSNRGDNYDTSEWVKREDKSKRLYSKKLARELGMSPKTLCTKLNKGILGSDEIEEIIRILGIKNPIEIFFCKISYLKSKNYDIRIKI